ncbi:hypothetical protein K7X08_004283 [Anisodus acutangulus]|uniref:Protein kinase domain-containing protein n=1 Tax=Anisodus acutangulus TaxID=402998 RepID=A0A9Q1MH01_9SOLA|nr:hypothetical protein K7X08_004283 [Anisodus acutangulus]
MIADFGLSVTLEQDMNEKHESIRGTKSFMAPESVLNNKYGPEVDIWALGCTVYELLTGTALWESDSGREEDADNDVWYKIGSEEPEFHNSKLSNEAQDFIKAFGTYGVTHFQAVEPLR